MLRTTGDNLCKVPTLSVVNNMNDLVSDQEETDTKIILHSLHTIIKINATIFPKE